MNLVKLNNVPVNNLDSERAVGFVQYGLKSRGAIQLAAVSRALVEGKGLEMIEGQDMAAKLKGVVNYHVLWGLG